MGYKGHMSFISLLANIMKMTTVILISILFISCNGSKKKIENRSIHQVYNKCYSENLKVEETSIKYYLKEFENILIKNKLLIDSTSQSYKKFINEYSNYNYIDLKESYSFLDKINGLDFGDYYSNCVNEIREHEHFRTSIWGKLDNYFLQNELEVNKENTIQFLQSQPFDTIFNERTFEFDFFKHKLFNVIKVSSGNESEIESTLYKKSNYSKRAEITIDSKNKVTWQRSIVSQNKLLDNIYKYIHDCNKETIIFIELSPNASYASYISVLNQIEHAKQKLKKEKSVNLYNKEYEDLSRHQKELIDKKYNFKISKKTLANTIYSK